MLQSSIRSSGLGEYCATVCRRHVNTPSTGTRCAPPFFLTRLNKDSLITGQKLTLSKTFAPVPTRRVNRGILCSAAAAEAKEGGLGKTLYLGVLFGGWYLFNIYFNIYNKQVLKVYPYPITCTLIQFAVGGVIASSMWAFGLLKKPTVDKNLLISILPLALVHTLGNLLTNISLGQVAVSFTHTIKAMEPFFFSLALCYFLGDTPTVPIVLSLLPIVGGVALASATEATFNWPGFLAAMGSNITFQSRNVFSKKFMGKGKGGLDNINLFSIITVMSFFILAPVALLKEGMTFSPAGMKALGVANPDLVIKQAVIAGVCFHAYQQVSYMILARVSPVTHSIGNCLKRGDRHCCLRHLLQEPHGHPKHDRHWSGSGWCIPVLAGEEGTDQSQGEGCMKNVRVGHMTCMSRSPESRLASRVPFTPGFVPVTSF
eukprot:jgi/Botrbrau1/12084/Bobra.0186s0008.1